MKIRLEHNREQHEFEFNPRQYEDCMSKRELFEAIEEVALEQMTRGCHLVQGDLAEMWKLVEESRNYNE